MKLVLAHAKNPDVAGGYWTRPAELGRSRTIIVTTFEHASREARLYITRNELGAGNWRGGQILDDHGVQIAHVSYNGRVWEGKLGEWPSNEIKLRD